MDLVNMTITWLEDDVITTDIPDVVFVPLYLPVSYFWVAFYIVVFGTIFTLAIVGNTLVIASFWTEPKLRRTTNYFLFSLAHSDFLTALIGLPTLVFARLAWGTVTCTAEYRQYFTLSAFTTCAISVFHLVSITIERYIAITRPLGYLQIVTVRRCKIAIYICWFLGIGFGILPIASGLDNPTEWVCGAIEYDGTGVTVQRLIAISLIPVILSLLLCCYVRIFFVARKWSRTAKLRRQASVRKKLNEEKERKSNIRATVTTLMILGAFGFCWVPSSFKFYYETYGIITDETLFVIQTMAEILSFSNSAINPYLYALRNKDFASSFRRILRRLCICCPSCFCWAEKKKIDKRDSSKSSTITIVSDSVVEGGETERKEVPKRRTGKGSKTGTKEVRVLEPKDISLSEEKDVGEIEPEVATEAKPNEGQETTEANHITETDQKEIFWTQSQYEHNLQPKDALREEESNGILGTVPTDRQPKNTQETEPNDVQVPEIVVCESENFGS